MISNVWRYVITAYGSQRAVDIHVGKRLKFFIDRGGISTVNLANLLSVSQRQIPRFEEGRKRISANQLFILARYFDVSVAAFFDQKNIAA